MKSRKLSLGKLSIQSFVTSLNQTKQANLNGGDTEDNTVIAASFESCKSTVQPTSVIISSGENICIKEDYKDTYF